MFASNAMRSDAHPGATDAAFDLYAREHDLNLDSARSARSTHSSGSSQCAAPDTIFTQDSPPDLSLNTPSPSSSALTTSETGVSSDRGDYEQRNTKRTDRMHPAELFRPEYLADMGTLASHTIDPHSLSMWQQATTFDPSQSMDTSLDPIPYAPHDPTPATFEGIFGAEHDESSFTYINTHTPSNASSSDKPSSQQRSESKESIIVPELQPNPANFGIGSHYSHTSDADLGYTATKIVRPPKDQLRDLQVHVHGVALIGAKSRVETQIRMRIEMVRNTPPSIEGSDPHLGEVQAPDLGITSAHALSTARARFGSSDNWQRIGSFSHIKLPPGTATRRKGRKHKAPNVDPQQTLFLDATVVTATPPHNRIQVCDGCRIRERKRTLRLGQNKRRNKSQVGDGTNTPEAKEPLPSEEEMRTLGIDSKQPEALERAIQARDDRAKDRVVVFNTDDFVEFHNGEVVLPTRVTCYCRHHKEKLGFCVIFTLRDWTGQLLATGTTPPIMITDDHKTSQTPQAQAQMQAQAEALSQALSQARDTRAPISAQPKPAMLPSTTKGLGRSASGDQARPAPTLDTGSTSATQDGTVGRQQRRKSGAARAKPYARQSINTTSGRLAIQPSTVSSRVPSALASPAASDGLAPDVDPMQQVSPSSHERNVSISDSVSPQDAVSPSPIGSTLPVGTMPFAAAQPGLAADTLRPWPTDDSTAIAINPNTVPQPDTAMLMQAYLFARSQTDAAPAVPFIPSPIEPTSPSYDAMATVLQGMQAPQHPWPSVPPPPSDPTSPHDALSNAVMPIPSAPVTPLQQPPRISQLIPREGPTTGGVEVTVLGENFAPGISIVFGDHAAPSTKVWAHNTLVCILPPAASPGPVIVSLRAPNNTVTRPTVDCTDRPTAFFTYAEQTDRGLMELALQVVGLKMTGQVHSARDVAMRVVGNDKGSGPASGSGSGSGGGGMGNTGGTTDATDSLDNSASQFSLLARLAPDTSTPLSFQGTLVSLLALSDVDIPCSLDGTPHKLAGRSNAQLSSCARADALRLTNRAGQTMLHLAVVLGFTRLVDDLICRGAPTNARDHSGFTPLHFAALHGRSGIVRRLLRAFSDPRAQIRTGATPLELARLAGQDDTVEILQGHFIALAHRTAIDARHQPDGSLRTDDPESQLVSESVDANASADVQPDHELHPLSEGTFRVCSASADEDNLSSEPDPNPSSDASDTEEPDSPTTASIGPAFKPTEEAPSGQTSLPIQDAHGIRDLKDVKDAAHSSGTDSTEKALLAASLAAAEQRKVDSEKKSRFGLPNKLQRFFSPNVLHTFAARPLSVYRMEHMDVPDLSEEQLATSDSLGKGKHVLNSESQEDQPILPPPAYETAIASGVSAGPTEEAGRRRRRSSKKDVEVGEASTTTNTTVTRTRCLRARDDRMLMLFWLPALVIALLLFLYSSLGSVSHFFHTVREGTLFKLS